MPNTPTSQFTLRLTAIEGDALGLETVEEVAAELRTELAVQTAEAVAKVVAAIRLVAARYALRRQRQRRL